nr:MAG TPA: hypothetical protein [Caudoviricetes sp.]
MNSVLKKDLFHILSRHHLLLTHELVRQLDIACKPDEISDIMDAFKDELINCDKIAEELRKEETK